MLLATGVRWVGFVALATLVGGLVVELAVLPHAIPAVDGARRRLRRLGVLCLVVLVCSTAGDLVTRAQTMAGGGLAAAIAAIPAVLTHTHFGVIWVARFALLALALVLAAGCSRGLRAGSLGLALAIALTTTLTGHAADWGDLTLLAGTDWVHVVATTAWTGGLMALALAVLREARQWPPGVLGGCMRRFSRLAGFCVSAVLATGLYSAWVQLQGASAVVTTTYGRVLAVKLLLVLGLLWWGALNRYTVVPALDRDRPAGADERGFRLARWVLRASSRGRRAAPSRLGTFITREAVLAAVVFACTAVLVDSTPPRHVQHGEHHANSSAAPGRPGRTGTGRSQHLESAVDRLDEGAGAVAADP
jgi:putative copper export protein